LMLPLDHHLASKKASHMGTLWLRFADTAADHLSSLDPSTDRLAIVRWFNRWQSALKRGRLAQLKAHYHAKAARVPGTVPFNPLWSAGDVEHVLRMAGLR